MKIALFGATGKTGRLVLDGLLSQGHVVNVLVRTPARLDIGHPNLHIQQGDALVAEDVATIVRGQDAVVSTLGARSLKPDPICSVAASHITRAMTQAGVTRFVSRSGVALGEQPGFVMTIIRKLLLKNVYADALESDAIIQRTDHEWTIVRPYRMTGGRATQTYRISTKPFPSPVFIRLTSRADVADFMTRITQEGTYPRQIAYVSTRGI
jgi:putative NADH-flavin reductase